MDCYLCGYPDASHPATVLGKEFTGHVLARSPQSSALCDRCNDVTVPGSLYQYAWYWNANKSAWSKIFTRNTSWLLINSRDLSDPRNRPYFGAVRDEGRGEAHELINMPSWVDIRSWLIDPPEPPFEIAIADSGQKHILFLSQPAQSRDLFPVQFELARVWIERDRFAVLLHWIERLLAVGFSKTDIATESPKLNALTAYLDLWLEANNAIAPHRSTAVLAITLKCAQYPEDAPPPPPKPTPPAPAKLTPGAEQLDLFACLG